MIIPKSNEQDLVLSKEQLEKIKIIPVARIEEVWQHALVWKGDKKKILNKLMKGKE